jgi:beta-lactamase regulating signal transducer with metallopeptidase domain
MTFFSLDTWNRASEVVLGVVGPKATLLILITLATLWFMRRRSADSRARIISAGTFALLGVTAMSVLAPGFAFHRVALPRGAFETSVGDLGRIAGVSGSLPIASLSVGALIALVWLAGALVLGLQFAVAIRRARRLASRGRPVTEPALLRLLAATCHRIGVSADAARLVWAEGISTPSVIGVRRPVVLLPLSAKEWDEQTLRAVLLHEVAHAARQDYAWLLAAECARTILWLNPLVHLVVARLRQAQDEACDDAALEHGMSADRYARELVTVARSIIHGPPRLMPSMARKRSEITRRVVAIMQPNAIRSSATARFTVSLFMSASALSAGLGALYPWHCL